jgi:hypothetical protein
MNDNIKMKLMTNGILNNIDQIIPKGVIRILHQ